MSFSFRTLSDDIKQYLIITGNYWAFTLTDGALRMLVVLHFHNLGYQPLEIASLFLFYEFFGVVTNLFGGWLGARIGLNRTMNIGLFLQIIALSMLLVPEEMLIVPWVMAAQALSGIAKDLNKMSAKSAIKTLAPKNADDQLYKWVALLTGSKNALKGIGFFIGGLLLSLIGFQQTITTMAITLAFIWLFSLMNIKSDLGKSKNKAKFTDIFSKSPAINSLSAARLFLFGARDVWFVVALPVYLSTVFGWDHWTVGGFLALWVIAYGVIQSIAPRITGTTSKNAPSFKTLPDGKSAIRYAFCLTFIPACIALALTFDFHTQTSLLIGLLAFGAVFAVNSSLHSYLIVSYAKEDGASLDIGFYYMANALGRLIGTVLSGWIFQEYGLIACLWVSSSFLLITSAISLGLPRLKPQQT